MASVLANLQPGQKFGPYDITAPRQNAVSYAAAVGGDGSPDYGGAMPPLAIIAAGLSMLIAELGLGAGTVHAGQEVEFTRAVMPGEKITATAELKGNSLRRDVRFATVATEFRDSAGRLVATASSTVIVPA
jgi:hypothetical protein